MIISQTSIKMRGADTMVQTWNKGVGTDFECPHCGALYDVAIIRMPLRERDSADCVKCKKTMHEWNSTEIKSFTLKDDTN